MDLRQPSFHKALELLGMSICACAIGWRRAFMSVLLIFFCFVFSTDSMQFDPAPDSIGLLAEGKINGMLVSTDLIILYGKEKERVFCFCFIFFSL
jgi:hypothetical protein